ATDRRSTDVLGKAEWRRRSRGEHVDHFLRARLDLTDRRAAAPWIPCGVDAVVWPAPLGGHRHGRASALWRVEDGAAGGGLAGNGRLHPKLHLPAVRAAFAGRAPLSQPIRAR